MPIIKTGILATPDDPTELPYPGHARELAAIQAKAAAAQRAASAPLPGPLREAFAGEPRRLHGFTFQPVCAWLVAVLTRIESPLLDVLRIYREHGDAMKAALAEPDAEKQAAALKVVEKQITDCIAKEIKANPDAGIETVFCFVTPVEKIQDLLDKDRRQFVRAARTALGKLHPTVLAELERACGEHFSKSFATALHMSPKQSESDGSQVFFSPPPDSPKTTDLAGGSNSLAV